MRKEIALRWQNVRFGAMLLVVDGSVGQRKVNCSQLAFIFLPHELVQFFIVGTSTLGKLVGNQLYGCASKFPSAYL